MSNIKKIKNLRYTKSREKKKLQISECITLRNKLLTLTDWTQLPDANLRRSDLITWKLFRQAIRDIDVSNIDLVDENMNKLRQFSIQLQKRKSKFIPLYEKIDEASLEPARKTLYHKVIKAAHIKFKYLVPLNLDELIAEITTLILDLSNNNLIIESIADVINYMEVYGDKIASLDKSQYPLLYLHKKYNGDATLKDVIISILKIKAKQKDNTLQMEEFVLHYTNMIKNAGTFADLNNIQKELEQIYGYRY